MSTLRSGKICYLQIPATDVQQSADFYRRAFGWNVRRRGDGSLAFDDTVNEVSGTWVTDRAPATDPGVIVYIMVADAGLALDAVVRAGGEVVRPVDPDSLEFYAWFLSPAATVLGIYQQRGLDVVYGEPYRS